MPRQERFQTQYPGVYWIKGQGRDGKPERIYYFFFRKNGVQYEEKAGRQREDRMTAAKASRIRMERIEEKRQSRKEIRKAKEGRLTVADLWKRYKANRPGLKGLRTDENRFQNYIKPAFGNKAPDELESIAVDSLRDKMLKTRSPATVRNVLELLRRIVNFGVKKRISPALQFTIEMPPVDNERTEDLTPKQLSQLWEAIEKDTHLQTGSMMKLALFSGMRRGEMFRLKWSDIDFDHGFITLRTPKGGKEQKIPLNDDARAVLNAQERTGSEYVFPGKGGWMRTDIKRPVNQIKKAAGLPADFRALHGLRHVYASMMASSGKVDMLTLQKLLTHKSPAMTQRYAHLRDEALHNAGNLAGEIAMEQVEKGINARKKEAEKGGQKGNVIHFPKGRKRSKAYKATTG